MIQLTNEALNHLENLTKEHNKKYVRLQVKGGGCAGFEYEWLEEDEDISQNLDFKQKSFYNNDRTSIPSSEKKEDDPWI